MKTELNKIAQDLDKGTITDDEARTLLLGLLIVSESTLDENRLMIIEGGYGYYKLYQNKEYLMEGEMFECHKRAREIIDKYSR
tara:strand:+ start:3920 stop:4168 length:249 start_codon:yes stop_codon:yes gene_type:complete